MDEASVCNLPPTDRDERIRMIQREILPLARRERRLPEGRAFDFDACDPLRERLEALVAFERGCCGGLRWNVDAAAGTLTLRIEGLDPDSPLFDRAREDGTRRGVRTGLGGLAAGAAALVVCEVPLLLGLVGVGAAPWLDGFAGIAIATGVARIGWAWWRPEPTRRKASS